MMEFSIYTVPLKKKYPLQISRGIKDQSVNVFLKIKDKNITAWGESAPGKSENAGNAKSLKSNLRILSQLIQKMNLPMIFTIELWK